MPRFCLISTRSLPNLVIGITFVATSLSSAAAAQAVQEFRPLDIPNASPLICRVVPREERKGSDTAAAYVFDFQVGKELTGNSRFITASYEASGVPRSLRENDATKNAHGDVVIDGIVAEFIFDAVIGFHAHTDEEIIRRLRMMDSTQRRAGPHFTKPLDDVQKTRARELAGWLWQHRCARSPREATRHVV